ncbi:hypothetical protein BC832DRAFT_139818 [Gaertneriomyces semiglobifer]|nr:hypothetical protein BC832DRAFT_139818 [Gaertneriomyces semiglobifer]
MTHALDLSLFLILFGVRIHTAPHKKDRPHTRTRLLRPLSLPSFPFRLSSRSRSAQFLQCKQHGSINPRGRQRLLRKMFANNADYEDYILGRGGYGNSQLPIGPAKAPRCEMGLFYPRVFLPSLSFPLTDHHHNLPNKAPASEPHIGIPSPTRHTHTHPQYCIHCISSWPLSFKSEIAWPPFFSQGFHHRRPVSCLLSTSVCEKKKLKKSG